MEAALPALLDAAGGVDTVRVERTMARRFTETAFAADTPSPQLLPRAFLVEPEDGAQGVAPGVTLVLDVVDGLGFLVAPATVVITVNDQVVWDRGGPRRGWTGTAAAAAGVTRYTLFPSPGFAYREAVAIQTSFEYGHSLLQPAGDTVSASDAIALERGMHLVSRDEAEVADALERVLTSARPSSDAARAADSATLEVHAARVFEETVKPTDSARVHPSWEPLAPMTEARRGHALHLLTLGSNAGKVLLVGGSTTAFPSGEPSTISARPRSDENRCFLYDPQVDAWESATPLHEARLNFASCLLADGRILIAGGTTPTSFSGRTTACEIYDPTTDEWTQAAPMAKARALHTLTLLGSGKVLAAGGAWTGVPADSQSEIFDPAQDLWGGLAAMPLLDGVVMDRWSHEAVLLPSGDVLLVSGVENTTNHLAYGRVMRYSVASGTWSYAAPLPVPLRELGVAKLPSGKVLVFGGAASGLGPFSDLAHIYDPAQDTWATAAPIAAACASPRTIVLADGRVLHGEGSQPLAVTSLVSEVYSEALGVWARRSDGLISGYAGDGNRLGRNIVRLANGSVLATAQGDANVEKFTP